MDPFGCFIYEEFFDPGMKYECQKCGTRFGDECVIWDEATQGHIATCPMCDARAAVVKSQNQD